MTESHCILSSINCKAGKKQSGKTGEKGKKKREKEDKGRVVLGYRSRWIGTVRYYRDDDMVYMPVNYPLSLVGEASHPCNVSHSVHGAVTVYGRGTMARMRSVAS